MPAMRTRMSRPRPGPASRPGPGVLAAHWDEVHALLAVLRHGSFTAAAAALATEQSTISRRIAALERALDVVLFERGGRAPVPTEAATRLRDAAERIEAELGRFVDAAAGLRQQPVAGRVRLALTEELAIHVVIPHVLPALRARHPELVVDLLTSYRAVDVAAHEADIALRFFQTPAGDLVGRRIGGITTAVLAARGQARRLRGRAVAELGWVTVEVPGLATPEAAWLAGHGAPPPVLVCSSYQVQLAAIRAGLGVGVGARVYASMDRGLVVLPVAAHPLPTLDLYVVTRRGIRALPRIEVVMDALTAAGPALEARAGGAGRV
jgi:DNA-binding transcriptional LysR family regulator